MIKLCTIIFVSKIRFTNTIKKNFSSVNYNKRLFIKFLVCANIDISLTLNTFYERKKYIIYIRYTVIYYSFTYN